MFRTAPLPRRSRPLSLPAPRLTWSAATSSRSPLQSALGPVAAPGDHVGDADAPVVGLAQEVAHQALGLPAECVFRSMSAGHFGPRRPPISERPAGSEPLGQRTRSPPGGDGEGWPLWTETGGHDRNPQAERAVVEDGVVDDRVRTGRSPTVRMMVRGPRRRGRQGSWGHDASPPRPSAVVSACAGPGWPARRRSALRRPRAAQARRVGGPEIGDGATTCRGSNEKSCGAPGDHGAGLHCLLPAVAVPQHDLVSRGPTGCRDCGHEKGPCQRRGIGGTFVEDGRPAPSSRLGALRPRWAAAGR